VPADGAKPHPRPYPKTKPTKVRLLGVLTVRTTLLAAALLFSAAPNLLAQDPASPAKLTLRAGDHICIIGNTLADRMQHDGWLETYLHTRFPQHDLVFRNLGFSADELTLRLRSMDFGKPDQWLSGSAPVPQPNKLRNNAIVRRDRFELTNTKADVVFAFFGYNESFAGSAGLPKFEKDLDGFIKHTLAQKYNGKSPPRLVLFSPIAHEDLKDRNLPDGSADNKRLELYTKAMADVAKTNNVPFVDLFHASKSLYAKAGEPLTINGVHLNGRGNEEIAKVIDQALFPNQPAPKRDTELLDKLRKAVLDKNLHWHNRYRAVDGYSTFGERAFLRFTDGQSNYEVVQRELEILDLMTANREKRVWAIARGGDLKVDDSNIPDFIPVKTNKPGSLPGGKHLFLDGEEAIKHMKVAQGMKINLFASEKDWPGILVNPVQMAWDTKGRLWVACWQTYPHWKPGEPINDKLIILEDTDGDGKADKCTVFADNLHNPTGFEFYNGGVLVAQAPDLLFLKDTDGDDKADIRIRVLGGLDSADTHHTANSFALDPGGAIYFQEGTFHHTQVETPWGPPARCVNAGVFRYEPRTQKFEVYVAFNFANPHGHVFDRWGQDIVVDGTGANPFHAALFSGQVDYPQRHARPPQVYQQKTRPCAGIEILSSRAFPDANQGNLLVSNVIGFQGVLQYQIKDRGASFQGIEVEPIVSSSDPNFRPSDIKIGPDGAIYFSDWHNPIIGHMQHNLRDPNRNREHGRIYRVVSTERPTHKPVKVAGESIERLLDLLKDSEDRVRHRARIELGGRDTDQVLAAAQKWTAALHDKDANYEHNLLEALWLHQSHNVVNEALLKRMLRSPDFHARAAATRVLCYWRDRVREPLELLRTQINDAHPRVRLEAIRAVSFFGGNSPLSPAGRGASTSPLSPEGSGVGGEGSAERALAVAVELLTHSDDEYLRFVFNETLNTLERRLGSGKLDRNNIAVSLVKLLEKGKIPAERKSVLIETICRHGGPKELRTIFERTLRGDDPPALRPRTLEWLADAARTRRVQPNVTPAEVRPLLADAGKDGPSPEAIRLATAWKVKETATNLRAIALDGGAGRAARFAALDGLAAFGDRKTLEELSGPSQAGPVRFHAAVALSQIDVDAGAAAAAAALAAARDGDDPSPLIEAFLVRKNGPDKLAVALERQKVSADIAKRILRAMYLAGRNDAPLANVVSKFAGIDAAPKPPTPDEVRQIAAEATSKGDPARGEQIFRRADLGCIKCHAVNKAGGHIGPDLGPIGASSPMDYIITSILDPNASIKEEYLTKVISTMSGTVVTGVVVERNKNQVVLKDATGKLVKIAVADIDEEATGKSLMPEGITRILTRAEMIDLVRFVSELGKPGPYAIRATPTVLRWKWLREVSPALREGIPNRDVLRDQLLAAAPEAWDTAYTLVDGILPLAEFRKGGPVYLQAEVQILRPGPLELRFDAKTPLTFWIDEDQFDKAGSLSARLTPGRHRVTVRIAANDVAGLRLELRKPADSGVQFEIVHGE
jgi:putative heme-binding domain-containing protein